MKLIITGDVAKHSIGTIGDVEFPGKTYRAVKILDITSSTTDGFRDEYYIIDLPERGKTWVAINEFTEVTNNVS